MKSSKRIFILCLLVSMICGGFIYAQNITSRNNNDPIVNASFMRDDLVSVLDNLTIETGVNIIYDGAINGIVTCNCEDVPLSKALEIILAPTPYRAQRRDGYFLVIEPVPFKFTCQVSGSIGIANVKMEGLPGEVYSDEKGNYSASVPAGFFGKVQPVKEGYKFNPSYVIYSKIDSDRKKNDYQATKISSDSAVGNELKDPNITEEFIADDLQAVLDMLSEQTKINIEYEEVVNGVVTCKLNKVPLSKTLEMIVSQTDFIIKRMDGYYLIVSPLFDDIKNGVLEQVTISGNVGIEGVEMQGFPGKVITDADGSYSVTVDHFFTGTVTPVKEGFAFSPQSMVYNKTQSDFTDQDYKASPITCTISGWAGLEGVRMEGLPGTPVTDRGGSYSVIVSYGWSGMVIPEKEGYTFDPKEILINNITSDLVQEFQAKVKTFEISGNVGIPGVEMQGLPGNSYTDENGSYRSMVEYGWAGTVKPQKNGYAFNPINRVYSKVTSNETKENYVSQIEKYLIEGGIVSDEGKPVEGVSITSEDGINLSLTDAQGRYSFEVEYGWSGLTKPEHKKYTFSPSFIRYSQVNRDIGNATFNAKVRMLTIADTIMLGERPISGVTVTANPGNIKTMTDSKGRYSFQVPYGWTGEVTISKPGLVFSPSSRAWENVTKDIINGIPVAPTNIREAAIQQPANFSAQLSRSLGRKILFVPSGDIDSKNITETKEDILVMAEILDERFREPRLIEGVLRDFGDYFGRDNQQTEAIYMQGYGLVFMMEVNYQFSSLSQPEEKIAAGNDSDTDPTWEQARQRVLAKDTGNDGTSEYQEKMFVILKTELMKTLKYASNIRNIQPDEWIVLSVNGVSRQSRPLIGGGYGDGIYGGYNSSYGGYGEMTGNYGKEYGMGGGFYGVSGTHGMDQFRSAAAEVMTMRVKKNDIDEFSSGDIDFDEFQKKVQILMN